MAETRYRYRLPPCPAYDIPAMERWLEELAAKGLHLAPDGFFGPMVTFEEGPPRRERFRLEPTTTRGGLFSEEYDPEADAVELHRQMGWTYRARRGQFHIYSADDPNAPELHTDPQVQAITLAALTKHLRRSLLSTLFWVFFYTLLYSGDFLITGSVLLGTWRMVLLAGLLLWDLGRKLREILILSRWHRQLQRGEALTHRSDYRRQSIRYRAGKGSRGLLWIVLFVSLALRLLPLMTEEDHVKLDDYRGDIPFATLADFYPGAQVRRMDGILESKLYVWEDLLAPVSCDFTEYAEIAYEGKTFECYLTVQYFQTRYPWTARMMTDEFRTHATGTLLEQALDRLWDNEPVILTELKLPEADYCAWYNKGLPGPYLLLRKGNTLMQVRCSFYTDAVRLTPEEIAQVFLSQIP